MRDVDIRGVLRAEVEAQHAGDASTVIIDELGVRQGAVRVDMAVVNGAMHGFEIKSLVDTLRRLPLQAKMYSGVFDMVTLVLAEEHRRAAVAIVPRWWGIILAVQESSTVRLELARKPRRNRGIDKRALAELLWHNETLELLHARGVADGLARQPRARAWDRLCESHSTVEIAEAVRHRLRGRRAPPSP